jgi:hypothetical protein
LSEISVIICTHSSRLDDDVEATGGPATEGEQRLAKAYHMIPKVNQESTGAKASAFPKPSLLPLKPYNQSAQIQKLLEALQKLLFEPGSICA